MGGERRKLFGESNKLFLVAVFTGGGQWWRGTEHCEMGWIENCQRCLSLGEWSSAGAGKQGDGGLNETTHCQPAPHQSRGAGRTEPDKTARHFLAYTSTFDAFHLFSGIQKVRLNDQCKSRRLNLLCLLFHSLLYVLIMFIVSMLNRGILSTLET